jgi:hypothetical protein
MPLLHHDAGHNIPLTARCSRLLLHSRGSCAVASNNCSWGTTPPQTAMTVAMTTEQLAGQLNSLQNSLLDSQGAGHVLRVLDAALLTSCVDECGASHYKGAATR